jgi:hypothetical protein
MKLFFHCPLIDTLLLNEFLSSTLPGIFRIDKSFILFKKYIRIWLLFESKGIYTIRYYMG